MSDYLITVQGDKELIRKLRQFGVAMLDLKESMDESGHYLTRFFGGEVFTSRGQVIGEPWQALNPQYAVWKARRWPGRPPLIRTGLMQRSFKYNSTKLSTRLFNDARYFDYHQEGRGVPERIMMKVDKTRERMVVGFIEANLGRQMRRSDV